MKLTTVAPSTVSTSSRVSLAADMRTPPLGVLSRGEGKWGLNRSGCNRRADEASSAIAGSGDDLANRPAAVGDRDRASGQIGQHQLGVDAEAVVDRGDQVARSDRVVRRVGA